MSAVSTQRILNTLVGLFFLTATLVGTHASAQAPPAGVPAAPPGGVDPSKLPDTDGLHLGMSQDQAVAIVKRLYPFDINIATNKEADGTTWIRHISGSKIQNCHDSCDDIDISLSPPPNPTQVIGITRALNSANGTPPTTEAVVASLRKKYGKELASGDPATMTWAYDEQGQPINPKGPSNWRAADCAHAGDLEIPGPTPLAQIFSRLVANLCNHGVFVTAQILPGRAIQGVPVAQQIYITLGEKSLQLRDGVAAQQYAEARAAGKQQQEMKKAQQQKAPSL